MIVPKSKIFNKMPPVVSSDAYSDEEVKPQAANYSRNVLASPCFKYDYYLDKEIGEASEYRDLVAILANARAGDEVHLFLNGPGGYLSTCLQLVNLIQNCEAEVVGHLMGFCRSAHSFIFLACHSFVVYHNSEIMAHCYSGGSFGKGVEIMQHASATKEIFERLVTDIYYPFYTEEEVDLILDNKDVYISGSTNIMPRIERLVNYRTELATRESTPV